MRKPTSASRLYKKAFFPALAALSRPNQNETSQYEHTPTPSHPTKVNSRLSASTRTSIEATKRFR